MSIDQEVNTKFTDDKHRLMVNLIYTSGWIKNYFSDFLKPFEISSQQFNILRILRGANDWVTMNVVKERMIEKAPNATRLADKLMDKELLERKRSSNDRRVVYVRITIKGLELLKQIDEINEEEQFSITDNITMEEARQVSDILDKMRE